MIHVHNKVLKHCPKKHLEKPVKKENDHTLPNFKMWTMSFFNSNFFPLRPSC